MPDHAETSALKKMLAAASSVLIIQADNPDGDSLASALALEAIFGAMGKETSLYCGVQIPLHLHYVAGWDRVSSDIPAHFDVSFIVDTSAVSLLQQLKSNLYFGKLSHVPCVVIDHHAVESSIPFATLVINYPVVATGQVIYELAQELNWPLDSEAKEAIAISILSDSLGLMSVATTARSIQIVAELVEAGVELAKIDTARRNLMRRSVALTHYKGELLQRIAYYDDGRIAIIAIPWKEIETYSPSYNPSMLAIDDMRLTEKTEVAIAFKIYRDGTITGKIRCNYGTSIAADLAEHFGGGGHAYASGFKVTDGRSLDQIQAECIRFATELLANAKLKASDETLQHTLPNN